MNDEKLYFRMRKCGRGRRATGKQTIPTELYSDFFKLSIFDDRIFLLCKTAQQSKRYSDALYRFP